MESLIFLCAPHGGTVWEAQAALFPGENSAPPLQMLDREMRVQIPYAGIFAAFTSPVVEDIAACRFHVFAMPELPRDRPSSLRVQLCLELDGRAALHQLLVQPPTQLGHLRLMLCQCLSHRLQLSLQLRYAVQPLCIRF